MNCVSTSNTKLITCKHSNYSEMLKITPNDQRSHLGQQRSVALLYLIVEQEIRLPHLQSTKPVRVRRRQQRKQLVLLCLIIQNLSLFFTAAHTHMLRISSSSLCFPEFLQGRPGQVPPKGNLCQIAEQLFYMQNALPLI